MNQPNVELGVDGGRGSEMYRFLSQTLCDYKLVACGVLHVLCNMFLHGVKHILGITEFQCTIIANKFRFFGTKCITYTLFYPKLYNDACNRIIFMCFVWISEQTAIISLYNINWLAFITETECVYCAVRAKDIYIYIR